MKLSTILEGWKNDYNKDSLPEPIKELFDSRLKICKSNECGQLLIGICTACGCPVKKKTKVLEEECPVNMWEPIKYEIDGKECIVVNELPDQLRKLIQVAGPLEVIPDPTDEDNVIGIMIWEEWQKFLSLLNYELNK